jgi:hypothetical protein
MLQIFISYSRDDSGFVEDLIPQLQIGFPDLRIWHDKSPHGLQGGDLWWEAILIAIAESDVFVYILSNESVQSRYCQAEFTEARRLQKRIITVQARHTTELNDELDDIQFIDMGRGLDDSKALLRLYAAISKQLKLAKKSPPLWESATPKPHKEVILHRLNNAIDREPTPLTQSSVELEAAGLLKKGLTWKVVSVIIALLH